MFTITFPLFLTLFRLVVSPILIPFLIVYLLPLNFLWVNCLLAAVFIGISLTDFFDGYFARKHNQVSLFGKVLDPLADKFLTSSVLVALLAAGKIYFYWVICFVVREFFVLGIRQVALELKYSVSVSWLGKVKTAFQMAMITILILNPYQHAGIAGAPKWNICEASFIGITLFLSVFTAYQYYEQFMQIFRMIEQRGK